MNTTLARRLTAEGLGTAFLLAAVVGSGIMGERLADGNAALALLANTLATGAALTVLISIFAPISGAHFNPVVTLVFMARHETKMTDGIAYIRYVGASATRNLARRPITLGMLVAMAEAMT
jgi:glycerol uptake facilitator-like aquaporin